MNSQEKKIITYSTIIPLIGVVFITIAATFIFLGKMNIQQKNELEDKEKTFVEYKKAFIKRELKNVVSYINYYRQSADKRLRKNIKTRVYEAENIIRSTMKNSKNKKASKEALIKILRNIRFNDGRGFYAVVDRKTEKFIVHPSLEGQIVKDNFLDSEKYTYDSVKKVLYEKGESFYQLEFKKPYEMDNKHYKKVLFAKYIKEADWFVVTGEYLEDIEYEIKSEMLERIKEIRYGKNGYFFIFDKDGVNILHPLNPELEGKDLSSFKTIDGTYLFKELIESAQEKEQKFIQYKWQKPSNKKQISEKMSLATKIDGLGWIVGTGTYVDEIQEDLKVYKHNHEKEIKAYRNEFIIIGVIAILISVFFSLYLSKNIHSVLRKYKRQIKEKNLKLSQINSQLEERVQEELKKSRKKDELLVKQSKLAIMGEMLTMIAHQWRQPLNAIGLMIQELEDAHQFNEIDDEFIKNTSDSIMDKLNYLSKTINDFSKFFKPNNRTDQVSISYVLNKSLELADSKINAVKADVDVSFQCDEAIPLYRNELIQIILNIINNALDEFISKKIETPKITFDAILEENSKTLIITDNAGGIDEKIIDKIFEPYFSTKDKNGTGLGLYMAKIVVESHMGGELSVKNSENGASFFIKIPVRSET
ncbi:MAG: cache domain-containing protein [Campylobacterales bacterium]|nr:cache domain-containing protein [Campylobacterales bacterium]